MPKEKKILSQSDNVSQQPNSQIVTGTKPMNPNEVEEQSSNFWDDVKVDSS